MFMVYTLPQTRKLIWQPFSGTVVRSGCFRAAMLFSGEVRVLALPYLSVFERFLHPFGSRDFHGDLADCLRFVKTGQILREL